MGKGRFGLPNGGMGQIRGEQRDSCAFGTVERIPADLVAIDVTPQGSAVIEMVEVFPSLGLSRPTAARLLLPLG
jgi:hypothetical protein